VSKSQAYDTKNLDHSRGFSLKNKHFLTFVDGAIIELKITHEYEGFFSFHIQMKST